MRKLAILILVLCSQQTWAQKLPDYERKRSEYFTQRQELKTKKAELVKDGYEVCRAVIVVDAYARQIREYGKILGEADQRLYDSDRYNEMEAEAAANRPACEENRTRVQETAWALDELDRQEDQRVQALPRPRIGMTDRQIVYGTPFGLPDKVNRTTTARAKYEQWVYENGTYLYFENGKLVTIQN